VPNPVIHCEVHGSDAKKSQEFYASVFGWDIDANNPLNYGMVAKGGDGLRGRPGYRAFQKMVDPHSRPSG
jgi:predicted enzyme related to lactoylglutathione lyase